MILRWFVLIWATVALAFTATAAPKRVALVFDDGPKATDVEPLLALLAAEKISVTFSLVGQRVAAAPALAKKIAAAGHEIANHSLAHAHARELDDAALAREVGDTQGIIRAAVGAGPRWYWPPYLETDARLEAAVARAGLRIYTPRHLVVSRDYELTVPAAEIYRLATSDVRDGSVILFHEWRADTRAQLPAILAELRRQGCEFFTFSALAESLAASDAQIATPVADSNLLAAAPAGAFPLVANQTAATIMVSPDEWPGVMRAARDLQADVQRVTGRKPELADRAQGPAVIVGTLGRSALIDGLVSAGKLDAAAIRGRWEAHLIETVEHPWPGVERALVIAGSDKRGTIYGIYALSEKIGVSPWYWWADVPVAHRKTLWLRPGRLVEPGPVVRYRGIFLNDEAPALSNWAQEKFGGFNAKFYARVFELMLRLRANYLWPVMWSNAFNEDDPDNARLADDYGIVMGTSHHEPMLRAQQEWKRHGSGAWDYAKNGQTLRDFWSAGVRRNRDFESIVTLGMRGDGDEPMSEEANVALLEKIVADQREILQREVNPVITRTPQLWALYKEVQGYYERGMRVPDDVTLLWCDDNWGNLRRLPTAAERTRAGGAGVYYHFDYVGGPRNYKWLNTVPITKIQEQLNLAWQHDANRIWIVNVGDLKPMEFPIDFFLTMAWDPTQLPAEKLAAYSEAWAARQFGATHAREIAALINGYTQLNALRKPEMLAPDTFSLVNYGEGERVVAAWRSLRSRVLAVREQLPVGAHAAFYQLVQHPIETCTVVVELHHAVGLNHLYAAQGRASANALAARARALFQEDAALTQRWDALSDGKWWHLMAQTHLGYTSWQQPVVNIMPAVVEVQPRASGEIGVAVEGDPAGRPGDYPVSGVAKLPPLQANGERSRWFEVFNRGLTPVAFSVETSAPWLRVSNHRSEVGDDVRIAVSADWTKVPRGEQTGRIVVKPAGEGRAVAIEIPLRNVPDESADGFIETDNYIAMEAPHFVRALASRDVEWRVLPDFGRGPGGVTTFPVLRESTQATSEAAHLEYAVNLRAGGNLTVQLECAPTLDFNPEQPLRVAVAFDDAAPQVMRLATDATQRDWETAVAEGVRRVTSSHEVAQGGRHVLKVWLLSPGVVLQRIVIARGPLKPGYLGPPESPRVGVAP